MVVKAITQPADGNVIEGISWILQNCTVSRIDIAAAYITSGGLRELVSALDAGAGAAWPTVRKRWITSFDYLRTEPVALETILDLPNSRLKIHDPQVLNRKDCMPSVPFHPKSFIFTGSNADFVLSGSGNVSISGLTRGHEAGLIIGAEKPPTPPSLEMTACVGSFVSWFGALWGGATTPNAMLLNRYSDAYESTSNLKRPTITEDDVASPQTGSTALTSADLRKLRACRHFWIEAGNITKNLGRSRPGNQLMMKRLSRVFFGVPPALVPHNSPLTALRIAFEGHQAHDCSLTFSDNGMDKLTLPIPGLDGPPRYDGQNLLFRRARPGFFELSLGSASEKTAWRKSSKAIDASFMMPSGRRWGVF
jgi:HKD family nuclease